MNPTLTRLLTLLAAALAITLGASGLRADPLPGEVLKFSQRPMDDTKIPNANGTLDSYWGHDELSTAYSVFGPNGPTPYRGIFMADDFADKFSTPVVHVKWWGSYLNNFIGQFPINKFLISFESDVPQSDTNPFSHPGTPLLNQIVRRLPPTPAPALPIPGTFTEKPISPGGPPLNETLYEYNAELHLDQHFFQKPNEVYWLKIVALVDLPPGIIIDPNQPPTFVPRWGWHNRDYTIMNPLASTAPAVVPGEFGTTVGPVPGGFTVWHFQDDAVTGDVVVNHLGPLGEVTPIIDQAGYTPTRYLADADGPPLIARFSKDLAFELYTIPEPGSCALIAIGLVGVVGQWRRVRSTTTVRA
jgi:hypothetical protein